MGREKLAKLAAVECLVAPSVTMVVAVAWARSGVSAVSHTSKQLTTFTMTVTLILVRWLETGIAE